MQLHLQFLKQHLGTKGFILSQKHGLLHGIFDLHVLQVRRVVGTLEMTVIADVVNELRSPRTDYIVSQDNRALPQQATFLERRQTCSK